MEIAVQMITACSCHAVGMGIAKLHNLNIANLEVWMGTVAQPTVERIWNVANRNVRRMRLTIQYIETVKPKEIKTVMVQLLLVRATGHVVGGLMPSVASRNKMFTPIANLIVRDRATATLNRGQRNVAGMNAMDALNAYNWTLKR